MKNIYELDLNEITLIRETPPGSPSHSTIVVIRVPGGWIYKTDKTTQIGDQISITSSSVFVPYSDEFKTKENQNFTDPSVI